jgi:acetyl-CoA carboxylase carboxyl transferase subunit alpha
MTATKFTLDFEKPVRELEAQLHALQEASQNHHFDMSSEIDSIQQRINKTKQSIYRNLTPWQQVQMARHPQRPYSLDYIKAIFEDFQELHGDRCFGDDQALIGGTAKFNGKPVVIIAQQKGRTTRENLARNFGMPHPEGYRKVLRLVKLAEKFSLPVISFIDTKAAFAGIGSEERHVSEAIARNLREMSSLEVPTVGIIIGEGGSGGALGVAVVDRLLVMEHAYYSVIPPEGCAAILWRSRDHTEEAAEALKLGGRELVKQGIADTLIEEPLGGAHTDKETACRQVKEAISKALAEITGLPTEQLLEERYQKYRNMGKWTSIAV